MTRSASSSSDETKPLLPQDWDELAPLLDALLDAPTEQRSQLLTELSGGDASHRARLERLVDECELDAPFLNRPAAERFTSLFVDDAETPLPEVLGGHYRIEREVGRGGMARVYLAHDVKHSRDVAVKVIRPDLAASLGGERFLREIAIAARLRHPNIVPLYDSGDAGGLLYFVMPYEEGPSLRARLNDAATVSVPECLSILRDVARGLAYAHEHGVVHRDVKPENVMMSGGAAVVTDFGIAKAVSAAQNAAPAGTITQDGARIGTPAYMAPEQAVGDPATDHRADIYSFGCLAYELFAGHPPFSDLPPHEMVAAHVGTKPAPLSTVSAGVPESVSQLVARCLEKSPAARPQSAQELLAELDATQSGPAAVFHEHRRMTRPAFIASAIVSLALLGGVGYFMAHGGVGTAAREVTVSVLPLVSVGDSVERDLAYGLSDEIATALVKAPGVRVMSRRSVAGSREQRYVDPAKTGRELGAQFLVMGTLKLVNGRLSVLAQLVQARDGAVVWADQFDRGLDDLAVVRDDIARSIADSLGRKAGTRGEARVHTQSARTLNPEAYRLYVLGQRALNMRGQTVRTSIERFRRATQLDSLYADAFSGLSLALALAPYFEQISTREVSGQVRSAAQRALQLDSTLAPPHVALGLVHQFAYHWDSAAAEFQTAVRLRDPNDIEPLVQYGRYMLHQGRSGDALKQFLLARRTEPASALVSSWVAFTYYVQDRMDSALVESARAFQNDSTNYTALGNAALVRLRMHDTVGALDMANRLTRYKPEALRVFAALGDTATALGRLREFERERPPRSGVHTTRAFAMFGLGDTTEAMAALERAADANEVWPAFGSVLDPMYDPVRSSARFHALLRRVNLPVSEAFIGRRPGPR
jgi:serine/threonine protein kinase/tetratricopeptide (TPR) repeat protein